MSNLLISIEDVAKKGYAIEYSIINQNDNGYQKDVLKGLKPVITYTVYITKIQTGEHVYVESFDSIETALKNGCDYYLNNLKNI